MTLKKSAIRKSKHFWNEEKIPFGKLLSLYTNLGFLF